MANTNSQSFFMKPVYCLQKTLCTFVTNEIVKYEY